MNSSGFAIINKPAGMSSFKAVSIIKKKLNVKKAGHTGTLDPFAEGLIVILIGNMCRFFDYFMHYKKSYTAQAVFGEEKDTEDITGKTTAVSEVIPAYTLISEKINNFKGEITQIPPDYSAVHVNGKRAYQLAREGIKTELKPRKTFIHSLNILNFQDNILNFSVTCSSGTYIRSIARDLARDCGSAAYLKSLVRTEIGNFKIENAVSPDNFSTEDLLSEADGIKMMGLNTCIVKDSFKENIFNGKIPDYTFFTDIPEEGSSAVFDTDNNFSAFIEKKGDIFSYHFVIPESREKR